MSDNPKSLASLAEPYSKDALTNAERAGRIMDAVRGGKWLGCGIQTVNGGQYVQTITWAVRAADGEVYHLSLDEGQMRNLGFPVRPEAVAALRAPTIAQLEAEVEKWRTAENDLGAAYLRLRRLIPGALLTAKIPKYGPAIWAHTERCLEAALATPSPTIAADNPKSLASLAEKYNHVMYGNEPLLTNDVTTGDDRCRAEHKTYRCQRLAGHTGIHQTLMRTVEWYDGE